MASLPRHIRSHNLLRPYRNRSLSQEFVDGALGANNPVYALWNQAQDIWGDQLQVKLKCLVSIGTGVPALKPVQDDILGIWATLKELATETEKTAQRFHRDKSRLDDEGRYYRFNVDRGLEDIYLEESKKKNEIAAATRLYVESQAVFKQMKACANNIAGRKCQSSCSLILIYYLRFSLTFADLVTARLWPLPSEVYSAWRACFE